MTSQHLKKALKSITLIFIFTILATILAYVFRLILSKNFSVEEYGLFYSIFAFFSVMMIFSDFGLSQTSMKFIIDYNVQNNKHKIKALIISIFTFQIAFSILIMLIIFAFNNIISNKLFHITDMSLILIMSLWFLTLPIPNILNAIFLGFQKPTISGSIELFRHSVAIVFLIIFIFLGFGIKSPFLAYAIINISMLIFYLPFLIQTFPDFFKIKTKFDPAILKTVLKYSLFVFFTGISGVILTQTDTIMITYLLGLTAAGLYQAALPIANFIGFIGFAVLAVSYPLFSEFYAKNKISELKNGIEMLYKYILIVSIPIAIIIISYSDLIIKIMFGDNYIGASFTLKILAIVVLIGLISLINNTLLIGMGEAKIIAISMLAIATLNVVLNLLLIPYFGITGSAYATLICLIISLIISLIKIKSKVQINIPIFQWVKSIIIAIFTVILIEFLKKIINTNWIIECVIVLGIAFSFYIIAAILFKIININEIKEYISLIVKT